MISARSIVPRDESDITKHSFLAWCRSKCYGSVFCSMMPLAQANRVQSVCAKGRANGQSDIDLCATAEWRKRPRVWHAYSRVGVRTMHADHATPTKSWPSLCACTATSSGVRYSRHLHAGLLTNFATISASY